MLPQSSILRWLGIGVCAVMPLCVQAQTPGKPPTARRAALAQQIMAAEATGAPESLLTKTDYLTTLLAHEVLWLSGDEALAKLAAAEPTFPAFLDRFLADPQWMMAYLTSGKPIAHTPDGLSVLMELWKAEGASPDFNNYRELTAALANQWSVGPRAKDFQAKRNLADFAIRPVDRFRIYRNFDKNGRLHPMFRKLKSWELVYVVGQLWSDKAVVWLNEHVNLPLERYPDACWAVEYKGVSDFGDTVQGPLYLRPWSDRMNEAQNALNHGSVCGGLSTYGAVAAAAHGIPAYTVGQPGHCAMAVRFARDDWRGGFGGPDGGTHLYVWKGNIHYIDLAEIVFGDDTGLHTAMLQLARAHVLQDAGNNAASDAAFAEAVSASPMHLDLRREQIARMKERNLSAQQWIAYAESLLKDFGKQSHPAIDLCQTLEDKMFPSSDDDARVAWYAKVHKAAALAKNSWAWEVNKDLLEPQAKKLTSESARENLLRDALIAHLDGSGTSFGLVLEWGVKSFVEAGKGEAFGRAFTAAVAASPGGKGDSKKMKEGYEKAILAAEAARSTPAFQALSVSGKALAPEAPSALKLDLPAGRMVSDKGHIRASSSSWDQPLAHVNVLNTTGGKIHTKEEQNPSLIVELPSAVTLGGVLLVKTDDNQGRLKHVKVSRSTDGATWFPIGESNDMPRQWKVEAPPETSARWLKFEAINDKPDFLHLRNFIVTAAN